MRCPNCDCQKAPAEPMRLKDWLMAAMYAPHPAISGKPRWLGVTLLVTYFAGPPIALLLFMLWMLTQ